MAAFYAPRSWGRENLSDGSVSRSPVAGQGKSGGWRRFTLLGRGPVESPCGHSVMRGPQGRAFKIRLSLFGAAGFRNGCENPSRVLFITRHTTFCLSRLRAIFAAGNEIARMGPRGVPACPSLVPFLDKQERNSGRAKGAN
ncbi:hypothetical protein DWV16_13935 [Anaerotruncus sp. AF02-27]|nr:hypothetical protein DWV16_13935 [Anaerotruncus sp. AF02-27]